MAPLVAQRSRARGMTVVAVLVVSALLGGCARETAAPQVTASVARPSPAPPTPATSTGSPTSSTISSELPAVSSELPKSSSAPMSPTATFEAPQRGSGNVPWSDVGPGWFLVQEDLDTFSATGTTSVRGAQKVWLVDPRGSRHLVVQWSADHAPEALLVAWSPDGRHALFAGNDQLADVDLVNDTVEGFAVPNIVGAGYTPSGTNIVALADDPTTDPNERAAVLRRFGSDGVIESVLASDVSMLGYSVPRWLYSHDGAMVYLPGGGGLRTVSNAGGQARQFDIIEPPAELCSPVRWWDPHTILVSCDEPPGPRMWLAPSNGGTATALSAPAGIDRATSGTDWGSFDAVRTASGQIFAQRPSTCGSVDIASLDARGHAHQLTIPGSLGTDWLTGSAGERIAVRSTTSDDCRGRGWFGFYNPTTHTTQRVIDDPTDQVGAVAAIPADNE